MFSYRLHNKYVIDFLVMLIVLLNIFGSFFSESYNISSVLLIGFPLILLFLYSFILNNGKFYFDSNIKLLFFINIIVFCFHLAIFGYNSAELKYLLYIFIFIMTVSVVEESNWQVIELCLVGSSVFMSLNALKYVPRILSINFRIYNVFAYTVFDKSVYTLILTLTVICLLLNLLSNFKTYKIYQRLFTIFLIIFFSGVNILVIESKTFIITILLTMLAFYLFSNKRSIRRNIRNLLFLGILSILILFIFFPQYVPDYLYVLLNKFFGLFNNGIISKQNYAVYNGTYMRRGNIFNFSFNLFLHNIPFGVGFGNYKNYAATSYLDIASQTESSLMNILVEGGIFYFITHIYFLICIINNLRIKKKKDPTNPIVVKLLVFIFAYTILNLVNDYYNVIYWVILAFAYKISFIHTSKVKIR